MHVHFSYQHVVSNPQIEKATQMHVGKLRKLLARFSPDLIHLHGLLEFSAAHQGTVCSLNLWLPTAQLHVRKEGGTALTVLQICFMQLVEQVKKHKQVLRREDVWKRRRYKFRPEVQEQQAGEVRLQTRQQLREYLDQVLPQLERFVARELRYRELAGLLPPGQAQTEEIVDEVVARALENVPGISSNAAPFHLLVSEAVRVLNGPLGKPVPGQEGEITPLTPADDREGNHPPDPAELLLASFPPLNRQVYILRALEGFSWEEAAEALGSSALDMETIFEEVSQKVSAVVRQARPPA